MGVPQFILLILLTASLGMHMQEATDKLDNSARTALVTYVIIMGLLWWGGFFS